MARKSKSKTGGKLMGFAQTKEELKKQQYRSKDGLLTSYIRKVNIKVDYASGRKTFKYGLFHKFLK
jgi:hypothetical protein